VSQMGSASIHFERVMNTNRASGNVNLGNFVSVDSKGLYGDDEEMAESVSENASGPHGKRTIAHSLPNVK